MSTHPRKKDGIEVSEAADGFVIHDVGRDRIHYLNRTAALILELCDGETGGEQIAALVQEAYDLPESPAELVDAYLLRLAEECLIEAADGAPGP